MKHIKTYEALTTVKFSELDNLVDKIKDKFKTQLEEEFSKYLEPTIIKLGKNDVKAFLLKPDFGLTMTMDFLYRPYNTVANVCNIFRDGGIWRRSGYTKYSKFGVGKPSIEEFVKTYVDSLKSKYIAREERRFKKDMKNYNL